MQTFKLDKWQQAVMDHEGHVTLRCGRQTGKSTVVSLKTKQFAENNPGTVTLVMAASQRQSSYIFEKIRGEFDKENEKKLNRAISVFKHTKKRPPSPKELHELSAKSSLYLEPPTQTRIRLKNGAIIYSLPAGRTGAFIRGLTVDLLVVDEAAFIPEIVWNAVLPMLAVSRKERGLGWIILLSTPFGKGGYFYESFHDPDYKQFHVTSEQCPRIPKEFLLKERQRMTKMEYAQEYLAEFTDEWNQFFPTNLIKQCMTFMEWSRRKDYNKSSRYYLGVDIARYGKDETAFVISELNGDRVKIVKALTTEKMSLTDTIGRIIALDNDWKFRKIFIDDAGIGGGVLDVLLEKVGRRVVGLNNASKSIDRDNHQRRLLKEDMYSHALLLMESKRIEIINDLRLLKSLKSIVFEYTQDKRLKLFGDYSHLAEAFVRACWCLREKGLKAYIA